MVSSGTVLSNSHDLEQAAANYMSQIEELASSWKGLSHDNLATKAEAFYLEMQEITGQLKAFAEAVDLYESYAKLKEQYLSVVNTYNNQVRYSDDQSAISEYRRAISDYESKLKELEISIQDALARSGYSKMDASSSSQASAVPADTSASASEIESTPDTPEVTETPSQPDVSKKGGEFVEDRSSGVYGYIESSSDGKMHTIYNQTQISGWAGDCNRAAAASIASAYGTEGQALEEAKKSNDGLGYNSLVTQHYFSKFGLNSSVRKVNDSYDTVKEEIVSNLSQGNCVMFDLSQPTVGQSGQRWTYKRHWVSVLDIKKTGDGPNDYAIFVSDSAHEGSTTDHGLGSGWYSIDEFDGKQIKNLTTISSAYKT